MCKKSIPWAKAREDMLSNPEVHEAYEADLRAEKVRSQLTSWRESAGLSSSQIAERFGISLAAVSCTVSVKPLPPVILVPGSLA